MDNWMTTPCATGLAIYLLIGLGLMIWAKPEGHGVLPRSISVLAWPLMILVGYWIEKEERKGRHDG